MGPALARCGWIFAIPAAMRAIASRGGLEIPGLRDPRRQQQQAINRFLVEQMAGDQLVNYKPGAVPTPIRWSL